MRNGLLGAVVVALSLAVTPPTGVAADQPIERGRYLVNLGGCLDCHTPGYFFGKPDMAMYLGGSDVGFEIPRLGVFVGPNLTPDKETGLGTWTEEEIVTALQSGVRPDGRILAPIMPWRSFAKLTKADARSIFEELAARNGDLRRLVFADDAPTRGATPPRSPASSPSCVPIA
jgi:mono/diheme cytochrome c family protein